MMYNPLYKIPVGLCLLFLVTSCRKYVELDPKGKITPTTINDFKLLINNNTVFNLCYGSNDFPTDDVALGNDQLIDKLASDPLLKVYQWLDQLYQADQDDPEWNLFYKQVYTANTVIDGVAALKSGTDDEKAILVAQAKVHRAYAYLCLVNLYSKQYQAASAATDLGVPLLTKPDNTQSLERASVDAVYKLILDDLNSSIAALPNLPASKTYPSKAAAYAILARTYLLMGNYSEALNNANLELGIQNTLQDLAAVVATIPAGYPYPGFYLTVSQNDPEVILMKAANNQDAPLNLSNELLNLLDSKDLRKYLYTFNGPDLGSPPGIYYAYFAPLEARHEGPRVPEIMLIKAECLARTGQYQQGLDVANELRKKRFKTADYTALTATSQQEALSKILQERRRELFGRGFRLFDLKRLNLDPQLAKTVTHPLKTQTLTLAPNDSRYVYPIAARLIAMSPEIKQNPR